MFEDKMKNEEIEQIKLGFRFYRAVAFALILLLVGLIGFLVIGLTFFPSRPDLPSTPVYCGDFVCGSVATVTPVTLPNPNDRMATDLQPFYKFLNDSVAISMTIVGIIGGLACTLVFSKLLIKYVRDNAV